MKTWLCTFLHCIPSSNCFIGSYQGNCLQISVNTIIFWLTSLIGTTGSLWLAERLNTGFWLVEPESCDLSEPSSLADLLRVSWPLLTAPVKYFLSQWCEVSPAWVVMTSPCGLIKWYETADIPGWYWSLIAFKLLTNFTFLIMISSFPASTNNWDSETRYNIYILKNKLVFKV